jgi:putative NADH-flavin reductase
MRIAVFGATGRLGREVTQAALARGHSVIAHSRKAHSEAFPGVTWVNGDPGNAVRDAEAVLITFGPRSPRDGLFCRAETQKIVEAMRLFGKRRLLCVTGAMIGDYRANRTWWFQRLARWTQKRYASLLDDRANQEMVIRSSDLEWTIFKPPRLTMNPPRSDAVAGPAVRVGLLSSVSRGGLARLMVREAEEGRFVGQSVFVKEP